MDIGEPARPGRHRQDGAAIWPPMGGELEHASPTGPPQPPHVPAQPPPHLPAAPPPPPRDPFVDTDEMGLRKFNIGLVPASVTPPRTWKRAAWFAVLSSVGVLVGLAIAAAKLVGSSNPVERIGMPGYPSDVPLLTGFATTAPPSTTAAPGDRKPTGLLPDGFLPPTGARTAAGGSPSTGRTAAVPGTPGTPTSPNVTTVPVETRPVVDAEAIAISTELFYEEVAADTDTALTMVSDAFRSTGEALLEQRFADVSAIEVAEITVDPAKGLTVSTLHVKHKDGSTTTEKRELVFTTDGVPLIDSERPAAGP